MVTELQDTQLFAQVSGGNLIATEAFKISFKVVISAFGRSFWVAFGMAKNYRVMSINAICHYLGEPRARALPVYDTTSSFKGKGK